MRTERHIEKEHYLAFEYLKRERMYSFIEQIELIKKYADRKDKILEVGRGSGFLDTLLTKIMNYEVVTLDINPALQPDVIDNIVAPEQLKSNSFDIITCFEVLEHMPFEDSILAVRNMVKIAKKCVLISIPDMRHFVRINVSGFLSWPYNLGKILSLPRFIPRKITFGKDHYWEIGIKIDNVTYSPQYIKANLFRNLEVVEDFRCFWVPWHHFYVIKV